MDKAQPRTTLLFSRLIGTSKSLLRNPAAKKVHQFRTTLRRIESVVTAASLSLSPKEQKLLKQLDRIRKLAGKLRDIDVQQEALASLTIDRGFDQKKQVQQALERKRRKRAEKLVNSVQEFSASLPKVARLGKKVAIADQVKGFGEVDFHQLALDQWSQANAKYDLNSKRQNKREALHEFRLGLKRVRYTAEMGSAHSSDSLISSAKRIQDAIGEWRDWENLTKTAEKVLASYPNSALLSLLKNVTGTRLVAAVRTSVDVSHEMFHQTPPKKSPQIVRLGQHHQKKMS